MGLRRIWRLPVRVLCGECSGIRRLRFVDACQLVAFFRSGHRSAERARRRRTMNKNLLVCAVVLFALVSVWPSPVGSQAQPFHVEEATIDSVHNAYRSGRLTSHQLVQLYLNRIEAYDKKGPAINAIITINP